MKRFLKSYKVGPPANGLSHLKMVNPSWKNSVFIMTKKVGDFGIDRIICLQERQHSAYRANVCSIRIFLRPGDNNFTRDELV